MIQTFTAESWPHLCELLFAGSWQPEIGRFRSHYAYKGLSRHDYDLSTSLMRLGGDFASVERHLLRNFKKYAHRDAAPGDSLWNWLALGQHHGLPTRLLDWSYSPLVALHFATVGHACDGGDAVVWAVDFVRAHDLLPKALRETLVEEGSDVFTTEMLDRLLPTWDALDGLGAGGPPSLLFFEPPALDARILNQYAFFGLLSEARVGMGDWLTEHEELALRVVVPGALRAEVRDKLDQANVNERVLFPGLDGLGRWLRRHYSPRGCFDPAP